MEFGSEGNTPINNAAQQVRRTTVLKKQRFRRTRTASRQCREERHNPPEREIGGPGNGNQLLKANAVQTMLGNNHLDVLSRHEASVGEKRYGAGGKETGEIESARQWSPDHCFRVEPTTAGSSLHYC